MGYYSKKRVRSPDERRLHPLDVALVVLCIAAVVTLVVFIITSAGGGHLMF